MGAPNCMLHIHGPGTAFPKAAQSATGKLLHPDALLLQTVTSPTASPDPQAFPSDTVLLMSGVYAGGVRINRRNITLASAPGQWGVIAAPTNNPIIDTTLTIRDDAVGGVLRCAGCRACCP